MEQKIKRAILCLYAIGAVQIYVLLKAIYWHFELMKDADVLAQAGYSTYSVFGMSSGIAVGVLVAIFKLAPELKKQTTIGYIGAVSIMLITITGWALPACAFGLLNLLDVEVRNDMMKKMDIKI